MPEDTGPADVRASYAAAMGEELSAHVVELEARVEEIEGRWALLLELFGTSERRVQLLGRASPLVFGLFEDLLWDNIVLRLGRLSNGPAPRGRPFASLTTLPPLVTDASFRPALAVLIGQARIAVGAVRRHRDRGLTPPGGTLARQMPTTLPLAPRAEMQAAVDAITAVLEATSKHYLGTEKRPACQLYVARAAADLLAALSEGARPTAATGDKTGPDT